MSLNLSGEVENNFEPDDISSRLKINATKSRKRMQFPKVSIDAGIARTYWSYKIREKDCRDISVPFEKIYEIFGNKVTIINELCRELELEANFTVNIHVKCGNRPLSEIPKEIITFASSINASMGFDLYCYDEDNDFDLDVIN